MNQRIFKSIILTKEIKENGIFSGYASVFNNVDLHNDLIIPGAFSDTLSSNNVKLLWQHNQSEPIGNIINITEDARGLYIVAQLLLDIQKAKDAYVMLKSGAIDSLSIGYTPIDYEIDYQTNIRTIKKVNLWEISLVTFPANENAKIISVKNESALEIEKMKLLYSAIDRAEKAVSALSF